MAIPILDEIEKFITEHGSAPILDRHIELLKTEIAASDKKIVALAEKVVAFEKQLAISASENKKLKTETQKLKIIIQDYENREKISEAAKEKSFHNILLNDIEIKILLYLASNKNKTSQQIAAAIDITDTVIDYHLVEMNGKGLVVSYAPGLWCSEHKGNKYLIENKLIS